MLADNRKDFQLMTYLSEPQSLSVFQSTYAEISDYSLLSPYTIWAPIGILLDQENRPLHFDSDITAAWEYDIITNTSKDVVAFKSQSQTIESSSDTFWSLIPNQSCKRILEMWKSKGSDTYSINPTWNQKIRVNCDMETDGGGWTQVVYLENGDKVWNAFTTSTGSIYTEQQTFWVNMEQFSYDTDGEDLEFLFYVDNVQTGRIYSDVKKTSLGPCIFKYLKYSFWSDHIS